MSVMTIINELLGNFKTIHRLAIHDLITKNKGNALGVIWLWANPAIQIAIYAFIFGYGIRKSKPVDEHPFFFWLVAGFIIWMYINGVVTKASRSIVAKMNLVTKMRFPISITPAIIVIAELYIHVLMIITVMIILNFNGYPPHRSWLLLPYFTVSATVFLYALSLFNSAITTMVRDYQHIVYNIMRTMFFITPALFPINSMAEGMQLVVKLNPFTYLLEGYRDALIYNKNITFVSYRWGAYFWMVTIVLFTIGSMLHVKMRKNLLDYA